MNSRLKVLLAYLSERLREASTIRALIVLISGCLGYGLSADRIELYVIAGTLLASCVGIVMPDKIKEKAKREAGSDDK